MKGQEHVADTLSEYLNGDLPEARRAAVQQHLSECATCRQDLASLHFTVKVLRQLPEQAAPRSFALPETAARRRFDLLANLFWLRPAVGVVAALLVVVLALRLAAPFRSTTAPNPPMASAPAPMAAYRAPESPSSRPGSNAPSGAGDANSTASTGVRAGGVVRPAAVQSVATPAPAAGYPGSATSYPAAVAQPVQPSRPTAYPYPYPASSPIARVAPVANGQAKGSANNGAPEPLLQPGPGPAWYTPALGLLALLAVVTAGALFLLDRRKR